METTLRWLALRASSKLIVQSSVKTIQLTQKVTPTKNIRWPGLGRVSCRSRMIAITSVATTSTSLPMRNGACPAKDHQPITNTYSFSLCLSCRQSAGQRGPLTFTKSPTQTAEYEDKSDSDDEAPDRRQTDADINFQRVSVSGEDTSGVPLEDLERASTLLIEALKLRENYMSMSDQSFPTTTARFLKTVRLRDRYENLQDKSVSGKLRFGSISQKELIINNKINKITIASLLGTQL